MPDDLKARIYDVLKQRRVACFATVTAENKPWVRYVVATADPETLSLTFATHLKSRKVGQIRANPEVHLCTGVSNLETARHYVQVQGTAEVVTDAAAKQAYWKDSLASYFSGPDDPDYSLVVITPYRIEYLSATATEPLVWTAA